MPLRLALKRGSCTTCSSAGATWVRWRQLYTLSPWLPRADGALAARVISIGAEELEALRAGERHAGDLTLDIQHASGGAEAERRRRRRLQRSSSEQSVTAPLNSEQLITERWSAEWGSMAVAFNLRAPYLLVATLAHNVAAGSAYAAVGDVAAARANAAGTVVIEVRRLRTGALLQVLDSRLQAACVATHAGQCMSCCLRW